MPSLRPFHGIRYADRDSLKQLTCPPYDVISVQEQERLHELHPNNAIRLELARPGEGADRYADVAGTFDRWMREGILHRDEEQALYAYRQDFVDPVLPGVVRRRVAGVLGALELEEFGSSSGVLPHERTMAGPKEDRLALLRALPVNVSPIYAIYRGKGSLAPFFDGLENRPPDARVAEDAGPFENGGVLHRLWVITAPAEIEMLSGAVAPGPLVIADGHHRYETALAFHRENEGTADAHDAIMCFCVDADAEGLVVLPYHRIVRTAASEGDIVRRLEERFGGRTAGGKVPDTGDVDAALASSAADHPFLVVLPGSTVLAEVSNAEVAARVGERHEAWLALDVVALHEALLPEAFGDVDEMRFTKDALEVITAVREEGWSGGILLRGLDATQVVDVASSGERMPQKASYFWPKAITGLVFRSLR